MEPATSNLRTQNRAFQARISFETISLLVYDLRTSITMFSALGAGQKPSRSERDRCRSRARFPPRATPLLQRCASARGGKEGKSFLVPVAPPASHSIVCLFDSLNLVIGCLGSLRSLRFLRLQVMQDEKRPGGEAVRSAQSGLTWPPLAVGPSFNHFGQLDLGAG